jgi:4-amino-4-deoxy-L-arabinose transferase-like glycosyltransferase
MNAVKNSILRFSKHNWWLITILSIAALLRLWNLDSMPPHLRNDEAALGYNAYSILSTGRDEHGEFLPILFRSFGDWKPGLYIYSTVPFIAALGLNELAVRLPAAISGILGVYILYLIVLHLFRNRSIALASAFSLAISPWHIAFSRGAWEAQFSLTLILVGVLYFIKGVYKNYKFLIASAGFLGISLLASHGAKPAVPLLILALLLAYWKKIIKIPLRIIILSGLLFLILSLPIILSFFNGKNTRISSLLFTNKYQSVKVEIIATDIFKSWANHYSLPILFIKGDGNPQHSGADIGAFIVLDIVFLVLGIKTLINLKNVDREIKIFILMLLILSPLASVLTLEGVNFVRYTIFFILLNIIIGLGIYNIKKNCFWGIFLLFYLLSYLVFLDAYYVHTPAKNGAWQTGYKEVVKFVTPIQKNYKKIYVPQGGDQPYIFFLFYKKYSPKDFQGISSSVTITNGSGSGMDYVSNLDNIEFVNLEDFSPPSDQPYLVIIPENKYYDIEQSLRTIHEVKDPIGFTVFKIDEYIPKRL